MRRRCAHEDAAPNRTKVSECELGDSGGQSPRDLRRIIFLEMRECEGFVGAGRMSRITNR